MQDINQGVFAPMKSSYRTYSMDRSRYSGLNHTHRYFINEVLAIS